MLNTVKELISNKKVLILGFGREGKSSFELIKKAGGYSKLAIADMNMVETGDETTIVCCGKNYQDAINDYDIVFKSPGVVLDHDISKYSANIVSQTECFFKRYRNQIIGITGTKGKSTTTKLIYSVLKDAKRDVVMAGNIGIPSFDIWKQINEDTLIVVEMSSHQLEYMTVSPAIAVYLNIHEEHLDHYGTMEKYVHAKENIYRNQMENDILFVNELIAPKSECASNIVTIGYDNANIKISGNCFEINGLVYTIPVEHIKLIGEHNYFDIAAAFGVCRHLGVTIGDFTEGLCAFEPLPHRLQFIGTVDGVKYYDDSISTICDTAISALKSIKDVDTIIIGGMDRGIDYKELIEFLSIHNVSNIILMAVTGQRIYNEIVNDYKDFLGKERLHLVDTLKEAVQLAKTITAKGKSCVMSPAAASYGIFKNFEERGEVFTSLVKE